MLDDLSSTPGLTSTRCRFSITAPLAHRFCRRMVAPTGRQCGRLLLLCFCFCCCFAFALAHYDCGSGPWISGGTIEGEMCCPPVTANNPTTCLSSCETVLRRSTPSQHQNCTRMHECAGGAARRATPVSSAPLLRISATTRCTSHEWNSPAPTRQRALTESGTVSRLYGLTANNLLHLCWLFEARTNDALARELVRFAFGRAHVQREAAVGVTPLRRSHDITCRPARGGFSTTRGPPARAHRHEGIRAADW